LEFCKPFKAFFQEAAALLGADVDCNAQAANNPQQNVGKRREIELRNN
jgi:hypothetical protein